MGSPTGVTLSPPANPLSTPLSNRKGAEGYVAVGRWAQVAVYATHHATEALAVADRVAVLAAGKVVQVGTPEQVYECPVDLDVARLTGPVSLVEPDLLDGASPSGPALLVRPDWISFGGDVPGVVIHVRYRGPHRLLRRRGRRHSAGPRNRAKLPDPWRHRRYLDPPHLNLGTPMS